MYKRQAIARSNNRVNSGLFNCLAFAYILSVISQQTPSNISLAAISSCNLIVGAAIINFLLGLFFIGKKFALSTLISTFAFPVLLEFFNTNAIFHNYCQDTLLAVVLAGCLVGIGVGLMIRSDASSGGRCV